MKAAAFVAVLSAVFLTACATTKPCKVTPPPAPAIQPAAPAPAELPVSSPPVAINATPAPVVAEKPTPDPLPDYEGLFAKSVGDVFFDFDKSTLDSNSPSQVALADDIIFLKQFPNVLFSLTSSCDSRGSDAYNDGLGQRRLKMITDILTNAGIDPTRFSGASLGATTSYCPKARASYSSQSACYQLNRRVHFAYSGTR